MKELKNKTICNERVNKIICNERVKKTKQFAMKELKNKNNLQ